MTFLILNSISGGEIFIVLLIALMFFGAGSIPKIARTFGRTVRQIKDATQDIQRDIQDSARESSKQIRELEDDINKTIKD